MAALLRAGETRNLGVIPPDSQLMWFEGRMIVVHPNGPPFCIWPDGRREILQVRDGVPVVVTTTASGEGRITAEPTDQNVPLTLD